MNIETLTPSFSSPPKYNAREYLCIDPRYRKYFTRRAVSAKPNGNLILCLCFSHGNSLFSSLGHDFFSFVPSYRKPPVQFNISFSPLSFPILFFEHFRRIFFPRVFDFFTLASLSLSLPDIFLEGNKIGNLQTLLLFDCLLLAADARVLLFYYF